ncbi:hypothetical protein [Aureliella helgolandensis]|uniref:Uncharacterized protein n=1 Tax=Aureliella helgolandensis TaxID=2527968 RepID=A0A518GDY0_9BACT|nr:hypothetical protein [Aureliella helgolandensis]QDV26806.1 hypothetical protein Q31a_51850 [Aureliella helgolandensis]
MLPKLRILKDVEDQPSLPPLSGTISSIGEPVGGSAARSSGPCGWKVSYRSSAINKVCQPLHSFALVGSAPFCDIRLDGKGIPWVAYFLFRTENSVEVWPLAQFPKAYCGCLLSGTQMECLGGKIKIQFEAPSKPWKQPKVWPVIDFEFLDKRISVFVNAVVSTVGAGFPSSLRLPGTQLSDAQLILVWHDDQLSVTLIPNRGSRATLQVANLPMGEEIKFRDVRLAFIGVRAPRMVRGDSPLVLPQSLTLETSAGELVQQQRCELLSERIRDEFQDRRVRSLRTRWGIATFCALVAVAFGTVFAWQLFHGVGPYLFPS